MQGADPIKLLKQAKRNLKQNPCDGLTLVETDFTRLKWKIMIKGPEKTPYANGNFLVQIKFSKDFPLKCPQIIMITPIFHPNFNDKYGHIILETATNWNPSISIRDILIEIITLLKTPNCNSTYYGSSQDLYFNDYNRFVNVAKQWTQRHAIVNESKKNKIIKDIKSKFKQLKNNKQIVSYCTKIECINDYNWQIIMNGPKDTSYENGRFIIGINFEQFKLQYYPNELSPNVKFLTNILHPNIINNYRFKCKNIENLGKLKFGDISDGYRYDKDKWIVELIKLIYNTLKEPNFNPKDKNPYMKNKDIKIAKKWTKKFARKYRQIKFNNISNDRNVKVSLIFGNVNDNDDDDKKNYLKKYINNEIDEYELEKYFTFCDINANQSKEFIIPNTMHLIYYQLLVNGFLNDKKINFKDVSNIIIKYLVGCVMQYSIVVMHVKSSNGGNFWCKSITNASNSVEFNFDGICWC